MRPRCNSHNRTMVWMAFQKLWRCRMRGCPEVSISAPPRHLKEKARKLRDPRSEVRTLDSGREILRGRAKRDRWMEVYRLDGGRCVKCGKQLDPPYAQSVSAAEIHHIPKGRSKSARGSGGSKRDDRIFVDGKRNLETLCRTDHDKEGPQLHWGKKKEDEQL